ncbi:hypothetical protein OSTOST_01215 [Ostertagia ostertagi]
MDYAGPLLCKSDENIPAKYLIILLTCLNTRAIYVDLVPDMSAMKLLHTLRRFFATVAYPNWILCDNSQMFKSIADLQSSFTTVEERDLDIIDYCAQRKIEFKFIPSFSPWQGGLYEKMCHTNMHYNRLLGMEELQTIAKESEAIVNSRPLTYISEENYVPPFAQLISFDQELFCLCHDGANQKRNGTNNNYQRSVNRRMECHKQYTQSHLEQMVSRVPHKLLRTISQEAPTSTMYQRISTKEERHCSDSRQKPRKRQWQIGQIISSSDNYQRLAKVKLPSKRIITRPINLLCKMEICDTKETTSKEASPPTPPRGHPMMTRSKTLAKNAGTLLSLAIVVTLCSTTNASTRCPSELNIPKKIIYATNCVNRRVALATY